MKKLVRDGKVAVLVSAEFGAGWYSWHGIPELLFDPHIIKMLELDWPRDTIINHCEKLYGEEHYYGAIDGLRIVWVDEGTKFRIDEYDGKETLVTEDQDKWITA
jgi:hypothetical protein